MLYLCAATRLAGGCCRSGLDETKRTVSLFGRGNYRAPIRLIEWQQPARRRPCRNFRTARAVSSPLRGHPRLALGTQSHVLADHLSAESGRERVASERRSNLSMADNHRLGSGRLIAARGRQRRACTGPRWRPVLLARGVADHQPLLLRLVEWAPHSWQRILRPALHVGVDLVGILWGNCGNIHGT